MMSPVIRSVTTTIPDKNTIKLKHRRRKPGKYDQKKNEPFGN